MKAVLVERLGGPEVLETSEIPVPTPGAGELLVSVEASGLNYIDTYHRSGAYPMRLPFTPGVEGAGTVTAIGDGVEAFKLGDRVGWVDVPGSYAESHVIPVDRTVLLPDGIDTATAAALLLQGITSHYLATDTFPLSPGDRCVIHAGAGGVGLLLTQIAKKMGATVFATVGTEEKAVLAREAGADHVIEYTREDFQTVIERIIGAKEIDVVYDGVGAATFEKGLDLLRPRGMMVTFGNASGPPPEISPLTLSQKGSLFLTRPTLLHYISTPDELVRRVTQLFAWVRDGSLQVRIGAEFSLDQAADAHRALEGRSTTGKVLIRP